MRVILPAIKTALQAAITYVADADIFVVPHADYIPNGASFPCIAIKDGDISNTGLMGGCVEQIMTVFVIPYVAMASDENSIVGAGAVKGLLQVVEDIEAALNNNVLSISGLQGAYCNISAPSELMGDERVPLQRKIITVTYEKEG